MQNILLLVDTRNISFYIPKVFNNPGAKLDFGKFLERCAGDDHLFRTIAFVVNSNENNHQFTGFLKHVGFEVKYNNPIIEYGKKPIFIKSNVMLAVTAMQIINTGKIDRVIIASNDYELTELVSAIKAHGVSCEIFASRIPQVLKELANKYTEIDATLLYKPTAIEAK